ncbi:hypothetical protein [Polaribacter reichenbachii]|uniref:hypothetical protein n=1 Tax=Polaribacter reichenbachii TaxID=996801 RepID=UPI000A9728FF|nr:hypothetical protein [Polaribacter reichenbachii]
MKNLRKIIALFALIFLTGIYISVQIINGSLQKEMPPKETVEIQKDTLYLLEAEKKAV